MLIEQTSTLLFHFKLEEGSLQMVLMQNEKGQYGIIENVFVKEQFRKQGIASNLVAEAVKLAKRLKMYKIVLTCSEDLTPMYAKMGFTWYPEGQSHCMRMNLQYNHKETQ